MATSFASRRPSGVTLSKLLLGCAVVRGETNTASAARMLLDHHLRRLPVVDDTGRLIGLFTRRDVMAAALKARRARRGL